MDESEILKSLEFQSDAFTSLLNLTPAHEYYGSQIVDGHAPSDQWNRKKQTKEQKRAAKRAKLDPANQRSALDVMKEREAAALKGKRKRDEEGGISDDGEGEAGGEGDGGDGDGDGKRQKANEDADTAEAKRRQKAERRKEKRQKKKEKSAAKKAKSEARKAARQERDLAEIRVARQRPENFNGDIDNSGRELDDAEDPADLDKIDVSGLADLDVEAEPEHPHGQNDDDEDVYEDAEDGEEAEVQYSSVPTSPIVDSPTYDVSANHSAASSSSSVIPPSIADQTAEPTKKNQSSTEPTAQPKAKNIAIGGPTKLADPRSGESSPKVHMPDIDQAELQERLRLRIEALRAARKADGPDGRAAKSRQELLEQRRKKEEQRKAARKEQRRKAKEEEERKQEERLRGCGSPLSADIFSPRSPQSHENSFSFSRLAFGDGTSADPSLSGLQDPKKKKGPQDPRTALQAAQAKQSRIAGYDAEKRADIADKDMWLNAKKRVHGERVRDDTNLLKKALKRKEKQKNTSELQWKEREQAVVKGKEMAQKKRETNLRKRREEKGGKGKKGGKKVGGKKKGRPGFEGRFKA